MIARNLPDLFIRQSNKNNNKIAVEYRLRRNEPYKTVSWGRFRTYVYEVAYGLAKLGLKKSNKVAIISGTRYEWAVCDLAVLCCGGVVVPIYPTLPEEAVEYILNDSETEIVILEDKGQLQKIRARWDKIPQIKYAVVIEDLGDLPENEEKILSLQNLKDKGKLTFSKDPHLVSNIVSEIKDSEVATIIYTSGTTGRPKGVELTHNNILSVLSVLPKILPMKSFDKFLSFLPLSHVFERVGGLHYAMSIGATISYCSHMEHIGPSLKDSGATIMLVVPRLLEKMHTKLKKHLETLPEFKKKMFNWAFQAGEKLINIKSSKKRNLFLPLYFLQYFFADKIIFSNIRKNLAPTLKYFVSGGAPLSKPIAEFFYILGLPVLEGYGLTETSAPATVNTIKNFKIGTVGKPLPGVEIKIADDGEILIKGPIVFSGYYKNPEATRQAMSDGWFKSGDIGMIDADGYLRITDRKKDIIVSSSGKNIAPQNLENAIKTSPYISNIVVIGDKRKYLSALVTLEEVSVIDFAQENKLAYKNGIKDLIKNPKIVKLIDDEIRLKTTNFPDYEQIRKFTILPNEFTIEGGEMTPTMKIKRKFIEEKYKYFVDLMCPLE